MCRFGTCPEENTVYMCRFCGTRFCIVCLRGEFKGYMYFPDLCRVCRQRGSRGRLVEKNPDSDGNKLKRSSTVTKMPSIMSPVSQDSAGTSTMMNQRGANSKAIKRTLTLIPPPLPPRSNKVDMSYP